MIDIKHLAELSNILLTEEEEKLFKGQLEDIINFVSQLNEVETNNELATENKAVNVLRKDIVKDSLTVEEVLRNTDSVYNNYFSVDLVLKNKLLLNKIIK